MSQEVQADRRPNASDSLLSARALAATPGRHAAPIPRRMRRSRKPIDDPAHPTDQLLRLLNPGEVLLWSGDKAGAAKQFAIAVHLDITPFEKSELTKVGAGCG